MLKVTKEEKHEEPALVICDSCDDPNAPYSIQADVTIMDFCETCFRNLKKQISNIDL